MQQVQGSTQSSRHRPGNELSEMVAAMNTRQLAATIASNGGHVLILSNTHKQGQAILDEVQAHSTDEAASRRRDTLSYATGGSVIVTTPRRARRRVAQQRPTMLLTTHSELLLDPIYLTHLLQPR